MTSMFIKKKKKKLAKAFECLFSHGRGIRARHVSTCFFDQLRNRSLRKKISGLYKKRKVHIIFWKKGDGCINLWSVFFFELNILLILFDVSFWSWPLFCAVRGCFQLDSGAPWLWNGPREKKKRIGVRRDCIPGSRHPIFGRTSFR